MAPQPRWHNFLTFEEYDEVRLRVALVVLPAMIHELVGITREVLLNTAAKQRMTAECLEWTEVFLQQFYGDRLEVPPDQRVDLHAEAGGL